MRGLLRYLLSKAKPVAIAADEPRQAERALRALLLASILLPLLIFAGVAAISYFQHFADARGRLLLRVGHAYQNAVSVFETFELTAKYTDELFADLTDEQIRTNERDYNARLHTLIDTLPQLRDIWIIDANGRPLVSGTVFPMPPDLDLSDRRYFSVHKTGEVLGDYVSELLQGRAADISFFAITRPLRSAGGRFRGIMTVSISPEYLAAYYASMPASDVSLTLLARSDGQVLARSPNAGYDPSRVSRSGPLFTAFRTAPQAGIVTTSEPDGVKRLIAYRRLPRHDVYLISGITDWSVVQAWLWLMASHVIFGLPATCAMVWLAWIALNRTRRESYAYARLREETERREASESALHQAQKMEAVGRLTGGIAHDFNNLLTAILGNVDMVLRRLENPDARVHRSLTAAREASLRAAALVQRLLAFSRQQPLEVKTVDLNRLVQDMSELLRRTLGETVVIETVLGGGLWRATVDPNQIENAILNLAINARDAMPDGGRLTIETSNAHLDEHYAVSHGDGVKAGQYVLIAVSDSGTGMAREVMEKAFEPFFTTKPAGVGTGLGLSMVYGFVRQSGGHIKIYSEMGEGTTIKMYVPRALRGEAEVSVEDAPTVPPTPVSDGGEKILLVEDDAELNRFGTEVLQELGYKVVSASDGPSALKALERHADVRLLFTDVVLPNGMNGRELAHAVLRKQPSIRVLFTTGYTRNAIVHEGRLDEGVELLTKPFTFSALAAKVRSVLAASGPADV
jgi:two-component system NtrC family sensor kinase